MFPYNIDQQEDGFKVVPETSRAAYQSLDPETVERNRLRILTYIGVHGGATCDEIEVALGLLHQSASALIRRLVKQGSLRDTGQRRTTRSGRAAIVWGAVQ
jgi:DNA-binding MarR family transcriptional regulator